MDDPAVMLGRIAHIVASSRQGPRGDFPIDDEARNCVENLIALCGDHHALVDGQPRTYSVGVLRQIKADHERRIAYLTKSAQRDDSRKRFVSETLYGSLLPITHLPAVVFGAPSPHSDADYDLIRKHVRATARRMLTPFLLKDGMLFTLCDLRSKNPFQQFIRGDVQQFRTSELVKDPEGGRRIKTLLNRAMFQYGGRIGVRYDPAHRRYYFEPVRVGEVREIRYRLKSGSLSTRKVVWQPVTKATGIAKSYWIHLGAALNFAQLAPNQWALTVRPERHLTTDGETPVAPKWIGRRVTRLKAKMYNNKYLGELQFWLSFLSKDRPRFILDFGRQSLIVESRLVWFDIKWPGVGHDEPARAIETVADDLFSIAELNAAASGEWYPDEEAATEEDEEIDDADDE
jgi:hypothetical protein